MANRGASYRHAPGRIGGAAASVAQEPVAFPALPTTCLCRRTYLVTTMPWHYHSIVLREARACCCDANK